MSKDQLQRFLFENETIRGEYINLTNSYKEIMDQHDYPTSIRIILGEALCIAVLLTAIIKFKGRLTVQFRGKGGLKLLLAQCNNQFHIRGLAKWEGDISYEELLDSFREGVLVIMLEGENKQQYQGIVQWKKNMTQSIEGYFRDSEQLATKIWLDVNENRALGLLLQIIPASDTVTSLESETTNAGWVRISQDTGNQIKQLNHMGLDYPDLLNYLYPNEEIRTFDPAQVRFRCTCTREKSEDAVYLLGEKEAESELLTNKEIAVTCDFCNKQYIFDRVDVTNIFKQKSSPRGDLH